MGWRGSAGRGGGGGGRHAPSQADCRTGIYNINTAGGDVWTRQETFVIYGRSHPGASPGQVRAAPSAVCCLLSALWCLLSGVVCGVCCLDLRAGEMIPEVEGTRPWGHPRKRVPKCLKGPKTTYSIIEIAEKQSKSSKKGPFSLYIGSPLVSPRKWNL